MKNIFLFSLVISSLSLVNASEFDKAALKDARASKRYYSDKNKPKTDNSAESQFRAMTKQESRDHNKASKQKNNPFYGVKKN